MQFKSYFWVLGFLGMFALPAFALSGEKFSCDGSQFIFDKDEGYAQFDGIKYTKAKIPEADNMTFNDGLTVISLLYLGDRVSPGSLANDGEISYLRYTTLRLNKGLKGDSTNADLVSVGVISQKRETQVKTYLCRAL